MAKSSDNYSLRVGAADIDRLDLLNAHYNPSSRALLESVGLRAGSTIIDVGCGHGAITGWMAQCVGTTGLVHAIDVSAEQLALARRRVGEVPQVRYTCASIEDMSVDCATADIVYSRFLLLHLADPAAAVRRMASLLRPDGRLVVEVADIGALCFVPHDPASELWKPWWSRLGRALGASYDVHLHAGQMLREAGLVIERQDRYQPVSSRSESKLLHALGFEQLIESYVTKANADRAEIGRHLEYLRKVVPDPNVHVQLYSITQYVARRRGKVDLL